MALKVMSHYEETAPVSEHHAFFVRELPDGHTLYIEFYSGDQAALELGSFEEARPGLNPMKEEGTFYLLFDGPAVSQAQAQVFVLSVLRENGLITQDDVKDGQRADFLDHPEAQLFENLMQQVADLSAATPEERSEWITLDHLLAELEQEEGVSPPDRAAAQQASEQAQREAIERGRARFRQYAQGQGAL